MLLPQLLAVKNFLKNLTVS